MPSNRHSRSNDPEIILASASPRRRDFLRQLGRKFRICPPALDELPQPGESPRRYARRVAVDKARTVAERLRPANRARIIIAADTIVVIGNRILGKPRNRRAARAMLRALSGRWHRVISGLCVLTVAPDGRRHEHSRTVVTAVEFKPLADAEIAAYIATGEPLDKAGAYAIQGRGGAMIRGIRGSYSNVVGLPLAELMERLPRRG